MGGVRGWTYFGGPWKSERNYGLEKLRWRQAAAGGGISRLHKGDVSIHLVCSWCTKEAEENIFRFENRPRKTVRPFFQDKKSRRPWKIVQGLMVS